MIVGIDLDHTISDLPAFFTVLAAALLESGHEVHVITYREVGTEDRVRAELAELGIRYTDLHLPQGPASPPEWKAEVARTLALDLMI